MRASIRIAVFVIVLVLSCETALAQVAIVGTRSCGSWVADNEKQKHGPSIGSFGNQAWLVGYLSGLAVGTNINFWGKKGVDALDNQSVYLWIDYYCKANPLKELDDAANALFRERAKSR